MTSGSPPPRAPMYAKKMQEYCQLHGLDLPVYKLHSKEEDGPHDQSCRRCLYTVTATVNGLTFPSPWCASTQEACNAAAKSVFDFITNGPTSFITAAPPPSPPPTSVPAGGLDVYMYKDELQEYTHKTLLELPSYHTVKVKGEPLHKPKFRSTVTVQNTPYTSPHTFAERKSAEQDAARIALKCLHQNPKPVEDTTLCKTILYEYAVKMHLDRPSYKTIQEEEGLFPVFLSTVHFHRVSYYTRVKGKTQKEAEQLAARFVIRNILDKGSSESVRVMSRVIQPKFKTKDINSIFRAASSGVDSQVTSGIVNLYPPNHVSRKPNLGAANSDVDSQVTSGTVDVVKKQADNLYLPNHASRKQVPKQAVDLIRKFLPNDKQAGSDSLPIHPSKKRNLGIPKQVVDPGTEFIPSMHTLVEKLRAKGKRG